MAPKTDFFPARDCKLVESVVNWTKDKIRRVCSGLPVGMRQNRKNFFAESGGTEYFDCVPGEKQQHVADNRLVNAPVPMQIQRKNTVQIRQSYEIYYAGSGAAGQYQTPEAAGRSAGQPTDYPGCGNQPQQKTECWLKDVGKTTALGKNWQSNQSQQHIGALGQRAEFRTQQQSCHTGEEDLQGK